MSFRSEQMMSLAGIDTSGKSREELAAIFKGLMDKGMHGLCFSPYEDGQEPGTELSEAQIRRRIEIIKPHTKWVRSFSCTEGNEMIPRIAKENGLNTLVGAWLGENKNINEEEIENLIKVAKEGNADIVAVGNEVMYREDLSEEELLGYIRRVKEALPNIPVGYVDAYYEFENRPKITEACDVILANCYPFWEGCSLEYSLLYMKDMYRRAQKSGNGKKVIITETGWPSVGEKFYGSQPSEENAMKYFIDAQRWSLEEGIEMFYFSSFDENWKISDEGDVGAYWGIWDKDEKLKFSKDLNGIREKNIDFEHAICYSGYRKDQSPDQGIYPSYAEVKEDLLILNKQWTYLRLYDCDKHSETVLEVIEKEKLNFKVMLGAYIGAEMNNFGCPWGGTYSEEELTNNKVRNENKINKLISLANQYPDIIASLSAGNEATVHWTDHYVHVKSVINYVRMIKQGAKQPVTFCENYVPWIDKLKDLAKEVDFISIHTYPVWEYKNIHEALEYTKQNYETVANKYPNKPVVITEAGWATKSNGRGIFPSNVSEEYQEMYYNDLMNWSEKEGILTFVFEAFDEQWKGSQEPLEPEKHWGLFTINRKPKKVMSKIFKNLIQSSEP